MCTMLCFFEVKQAPEIERYTLLGNYGKILDGVVKHGHSDKHIHREKMTNLFKISVAVSGNEGLIYQRNLPNYALR